MVIIAVLGALSIILTMVVGFAADTLFLSHYFYQVKNTEKAYYIAASATESAFRLLALRDQNYNSLQEQWAQVLPPLQLKEGKVSIIIEDEDRKININSLINEEQINIWHLEQARRLLRLIGSLPDLSNAIADWIDSDNQRTLPGGAELIDYKGDMPCKNAPLDSIGELLFIKGITKEDFSGRIIQQKALPGLKDLTTIFSDGKVNINTANSLIIQSLDERITPELAAQIIEYRSNKPFTRLEDILNVPGTNIDILYSLKQLACVKSSYFKIKTTAQVDDVICQINCVVKSDRDNLNILYWKVD